MRLEHLKDSEIQEYIDSRNSYINSGIKEHVDSCRDCRERLYEYQELFAVLSEPQEFELSSDFANNVIAGIPEEKKVWYEVSNSFLLFAGVAVSFAVLLFFIDVAKVIEFFYGLSLPEFTIDMQNLNSYKESLTKLSLPIIGGIILLSIAAIDRLIFKPIFKKSV